MRSYPQPGERWQHERGWTVTIIRLIEASPSVALVNPEFSCEVLIRHDSDIRPIFIGLGKRFKEINL